MQTLLNQLIPLNPHALFISGIRSVFRNYRASRHGFTGPYIRKLSCLFVNYKNIKKVCQPRCVGLDES